MPSHTKVTYDATSPARARDALSENGVRSSHNLREGYMSFSSRCNQQDLNAAVTILYNADVRLVGPSAARTIKPHDLRLSSLKGSWTWYCSPRCPSCRIPTLTTRELDGVEMSTAGNVEISAESGAIALSAHRADIGGMKRQRRRIQQIYLARSIQMRCYPLIAE